jgi:HEAT repeat protein
MFTPAHYAYALAQVDRRAGEKALLAMTRGRLNTTERWEAAHLLARVNRPRAITELKAMLTGNELAGLDRQTAQGVLNKLESQDAESALESNKTRSRAIEPTATPPRALPAGPTTQ